MSESTSRPAAGTDDSAQEDPIGATPTAETETGDAAVETDPVELLSAENEALRSEVARLKDQAMRALAEAENTRRRLERDKEDAIKYAVSKFARDMLEVADNLNRALAAVNDDQLGDNDAAKGLLNGVAGTEKQMLVTFEKHGLVRIDPLDQPFDPNFHQAMFEAENTGKLPGTVVQVVATGYLLHGRLLRPAMVGVAKGEPPQRVDTEA